MSLRICIGPLPVQPGLTLDLPAGAVRHLQVRRAQPGETFRVFDGLGHEWQAELLAMGRQSAQARIGEPLAVVAELPVAVTLAVGMPANERMDSLVEKATELGVAAIQPLVTERGVLRLNGERAQRRQKHWQAIAAAACEQCGRATVPLVHEVQTLAAWLAVCQTAEASVTRASPARWLLSPHGGLPVGAAATQAGGWPGELHVLSGPEGGLTPAEEATARAAGFIAVQLGPRILRADTAPLALLAWWALQT